MKKNILLALLLFSGMVNAQPLKVMSYNIRLDVASDGVNDWNHRRNFFTSQIKFYEPDIWGVQEATPNQMKDLDSILSEYSYVGIGRDGVEKGESSAIFFKTDRFKVISEQTFWLSETPDTISKGWDAAHRRVCTYVQLKDKQTKVTLWIFNTHLDNKGVVARAKGLELILATIEDVNNRQDPVLLMGDFNEEPNSPLITNLRNSMIDCRSVSENTPFGPKGSFNGFNYNEPVTKLIDYIFINELEDIRVKKYAVLSDSKEFRFPSDHFPVFVELMFD